MKRQNLRASRGRGGGGNLIQTRIKSREWYNELSSFSSFNETSKLRASRGRGRVTKLRQGIRVENGTTNRLLSLALMKRQSFRASRRRGRETEFRQGIRIVNGTTNRLLSLALMKRQSFRASRGRGGGN